MKRISPLQAKLAFCHGSSPVRDSVVFRAPCLIAGLFAALVLASHPLRAQPAQARGPEAAFGNTIVSTHPDGRQALLWLNREGTYTARGRQGQSSGGLWSQTGTKLCLTQRRPYRLPISYCKVFPQVSVGSRWADIAFNGEQVTNQIIAGR